VRCGLDTFGPSSLDFQLVYDVEANDPELVLLRKNAANLAIMRVFAETGLSFAYPTQTTFTAGPDGAMIMPYAPPPNPVAAKEGKA
jgi:small-conductance mechanosensitive channel